MSKNIETYWLKQEMREDLMDVYRKVAPNCLTQEGAWRKTVKHPAKRYYVTARQARQQVSLYLQGRTELIDKMMPLHRQMWHCIINEVLELSQKPEFVGKSLMKICEVAVKRPAPRFFIDVTHLKSIYGRMKRNMYDSDGKFIKQEEYNKRYGARP